MLELREVSIRLGHRTFRFDFTLDEGERLTIVGPSGSGKTTGLNLISGFLAPDSGSIRWAGQSLAGLTPDLRPVTTLFQRHNLFEHLDVSQNVGLGLNPGLRLTQDDKQAVDRVLDEVGLNGMQSRKPAALSGGEQQRVALARSLLRRKPLLLLDEPYSALDEGTRQAMLSLTDSVALENRLTLVMVTHQPEDAAALNAPVARMVDDVLVLP
ncbi:MAG: ATP-binding cassette domain-containing protein [Gammaproteobacteria bacterium]|nr:ATP-binding cassette domain-containing protein [Gammaproteobacteria bacterium]